MKRPRRANPAQLDLFAPRSASPPARLAAPSASPPSEPTHPAPDPDEPPEPGRYARPSAFTGGALSAVEAARVWQGLSIARAGVVFYHHLDGGYREFGCYCARCARCLVAYLGGPLFEASSRYRGPLEGEAFECASCGSGFVAHRDERGYWRTRRGGAA